MLTVLVRALHRNRTNGTHAYTHTHIQVYIYIVYMHVHTYIIIYYILYYYIGIHMYITHTYITCTCICAICVHILYILYIHVYHMCAYTIHTHTHTERKGERFITRNWLMWWGRLTSPPDLHSASWRSGRANGIVLVQARRPENQESQWWKFQSKSWQAPDPKKSQCFSPTSKVRED